MNDVVPVATPGDIAAVRGLFEEYAESLSVDLNLQHIDSEVASLPGAYGVPRGALLLARVDGAPAGCIGLRPFSAAVGELNRLYVCPRFRGCGLARALVAAAIEAGRGLGYRALVLDSLESMQAAIALYESFGFKETEPYWENPFPNIRYFRLSLEPTAIS